MISFSKDDTKIKESFHSGIKKSISFTTSLPNCNSLTKTPEVIVKFEKGSKIIGTSERSVTLDMRNRRVYTYEKR